MMLEWIRLESFDLIAPQMYSGGSYTIFSVHIYVIRPRLSYSTAALGSHKQWIAVLIRILLEGLGEFEKPEFMSSLSSFQTYCAAACSFLWQSNMTTALLALRPSRSISHMSFNCLNAMLMKLTQYQD